MVTTTDRRPSPAKTGGDEQALPDTAPPPGIPFAGPADLVVVGVDTHLDVHHAAVVLVRTGELLADQGFPVSTAGYQALAEWAAGFGTIDSFGIELTGSYGAALTRYLQATGVTVWEVTTTDRAARARRGKNDRNDAIAAGQKVLSRMATAIPKDTTGVIEAIRMLLLTHNSATTDRTRALNQIKDLIVTAPAELREHFTGLKGKTRLKAIRALTTTGLQAGTPAHAATVSLQRLAARIHALDLELKHTDADLNDLVTPLVPSTLAEPQVGVLTCAQLLITMAQNPDRIHSEAAFARLIGVAPVPSSSGKSQRMRLHRGGDRQANRAIHMVIVGRAGHHDPTREYIARRSGPKNSRLSKRDAMRILKRYAARRLYNTLKTDLHRT